MTVADRIKEQRTRRGWSQSVLAEKAGYNDKTAISKLEHAGNSITLKQIERIARALNVNAYYLMGWSESPDQYSLFDFIDHSSDDGYYPPGVNDDTKQSAESKYEVTKEQYDFLTKYGFLSDELKKVVDNIVENAYIEKQYEIKKNKKLLGFGDFIDD